MTLVNFDMSIWVVFLFWGGDIPWCCICAAILHMLTFNTCAVCVRVCVCVCVCVCLRITYLTVCIEITYLTVCIGRPYLSLRSWVVLRHSGVYLHLAMSRLFCCAFETPVKNSVLAVCKFMQKISVVVFVGGVGLAVSMCMCMYTNTLACICVRMCTFLSTNLNVYVCLVHSYIHKLNHTSCKSVSYSQGSHAYWSSPSSPSNCSLPW